MRKRRCVAWTLAVGLALAGLPGWAAANEDGARKHWVAQYQELQQRHAALGQALAQARRDYSRGRSSGNLQGEGKSGLIREIARLGDEFRQVDERLRDFPETARQAGALPGWFRDLEPAPAKSDPSSVTKRSRSSGKAQDRRASRHRTRRVGQD